MSAADQWSGALVALELLLLAGLALLPALRRAPRASGGIARSWRSAWREPRAVVALAALVPLLLGLLLLPWFGFPTPSVRDEFGYLLGADTFASSRLANPRHPLWTHFEVPYVLHVPRYASMYPPAQALFLGLGRALLGHAWWGAWLSCGLASGAIAWALLGWLPRRWALLGALLYALRLFVSGYWMQSYWGGAVAALGGALVLGALPRLRRRPRAAHGLALALGLGLLANSRPYEGLLYSLPAAAALLDWLLRARGAPARGRRLALLVPGALALAAIGWWTLRYFAAVTGEAGTMPYALYARQYGAQPNLLFQGAAEAVEYRHFDLRELWNLWAARVEDAGRLGGFLEVGFAKVSLLWSFYLGPTLTLPFLLGLRARRRLLLPLAGLSAVGLALALEVSGLAHYAAPATAAVALLVAQGLRTLWRRGAGGRALVGAIALTQPALLALHLGLSAAGASPPVEGLPRDPFNPRRGVDFDRAPLERQLLEREGQDLVLVRFGRGDWNSRWLYNGADLERAEIVWARELDPARTRALLEHYAGRRVWLLRSFERPPRLVPYPGLPADPEGAGGRGQ